MIINRGCDASPQIDVGDTSLTTRRLLISIKPLIDMR
jgi:hypothetical protein